MENEDVVAIFLLAGCLLQLVGCILAWKLPGLFFGLSYICFIVLASHWLSRVLEAIQRGR